MRKLRELSIFFPAYNEGKNIEKTVKAAVLIAPKVADKWEVIIVNDGSRDDTLSVSESLSKRQANVRTINHPKNRGYGAALKTGFYRSKYEWVAFTDADGQFDFKEITKFIEKQEETGAKLVIGYYKQRSVPFFRKVNTFLWETVVFVMFGLRVRDIDTAFKLVHRDVIEKIPKLESERGAFISSEFLIKARRAGFEMPEVGITHYPRVEGSGTGANIDVIIQSFVDLFKLWRKLK